MENRKNAIVSVSTAIERLSKKSSLSLRAHQARGKLGWALLWLLGVPLPVLLIIYLVRGH